jgi:hypothetical protein
MSKEVKEVQEKGQTVLEALVTELDEDNKKMEARELEINEIIKRYESEAMQLTQERAFNAAKHAANKGLIDKIMSKSE